MKTFQYHNRDTSKPDMNAYGSAINRSVSLIMRLGSAMLCSEVCKSCKTELRV